jgi:predicted  nucleic acid-binding Zn-ribbon protein
VERVEADHAKADQVRTAREVAAMFDELRRLADRHAELSADRARLEAEAGALRAELEGGRSRGARLEAEAHGARLDTAAAGRMADEANRRAADLADRLTAAINEKVELLKAPEAERRRPWWRRLFKR